MSFIVVEDGEAESPLLPLPSGKDEMNFAEFPIALLTDRVPKHRKIIKFEDQIYDEKRRRLVTRRRVIEGSEEYGLPTATDDTVILALIQLTKIKGDFRKREVEFTRLELIKMLGWADEGRSYDRIKLSLLRIQSVNYVYDNAWWDGRQKTWTTKAFHIIDNVEINDSRTTNGQAGLFASRIVWNEVVFDSFQAGFLRDIDFRLCMRLVHPTALRMYRFLGKRFYVRPEWLFDLKEFAHEHMGLGRNYEGGTQIARKLKPAIAELEAVGFLEPLSGDERFIKKGRIWSIRFVQRNATPALPEPAPQAEPESPPLVALLISRGVTAKTAAELVKQHPAEAIQVKVEVLDWLKERKDKRIGRSSAGYLVKSIKDDYAAPQDFATKAERERQAELGRQQREAEALKARKRQEEARREQEEAKQIAAYRKALTPEQLAKLEADALAQARPEDRQGIEDQSLARFRSTMLHRLVDDHVRRLLRIDGTLPPVSE
ncbi:MAG: replication initiator protein A [Actinomycetota bacterium]|nr:replication initiator protein A [Actinomycetota bacterium]